MGFKYRKLNISFFTWTPKCAKSTYTCSLRLQKAFLRSIVSSVIKVQESFQSTKLNTKAKYLNINLIIKFSFVANKINFSEKNFYIFVYTCTTVFCMI